MKTKELCGFTFIHAGDFYINTIKSPKKYKWGDANKTYDHITTCIRFSEKNLPDKVEQAYIITVDDEVVYVGEFSNSLRDRWLKTENYIWHNKDHLIYDELIRKAEVALWLIKDPYVDISRDLKINISKSIEHHILKNNNLAWNQRHNKG